MALGTEPDQGQNDNIRHNNFRVDRFQNIEMSFLQLSGICVSAEKQRLRFLDHDRQRKTVVFEEKIVEERSAIQLVVDRQVEGDQFVRWKKRQQFGQIVRKVEFGS
jgi:hypothetical protein